VRKINIKKENEKFRVMRVLVYEGDYENIQKSLQGSVPTNGERVFNKNLKIKSAIIGGIPDIIDDFIIGKEE
jgi:hypothetical protein